MLMLPSMILALTVSLVTCHSTPLQRPVVPCPANDPVDHQVFIPSADSCSDFYLCSHGHAVQLSCPSGLYFNPSTTRCDYPKNVNCTAPTSAPTQVPTAPTSVPTDTTPQPLHSTTEPSNSTDFNSTFIALLQSAPLDAETLEAMKDACPVPTGWYPVFFPNPANCSTYFICDHEEPRLAVCPTGLFFNNDTWTCDFPQNVDCVSFNDSTADGQEVLKTQSLTFEAEASSISQCPEDDGGSAVFLPNPADCTTFFECSNGKPYLHHCPPDLQFNNNTWTCDFSWNVHCV